MSPEPLRESALAFDLSPRLQASAAIVGSPAAAAETVIAQTTLGGGLTYALGAILVAAASFTVGTNGTAVRLRLRQSTIAGAIVGDTGALTAGIAAAALCSIPLLGLDTAAGDKQVYVLTLTVTAASAASTVSGVVLAAVGV